MIAVLTAIMMMFAAAAVRMGSYAAGGYIRTDLVSATVSVEVASVRGQILDCRSRPITGAQVRFMAAIAPTNDAMQKLAKMGDNYAAVLKTLGDGKPAVAEVPADFAAEGAYVFEIPQRYAEVQTAAHAVGYLDSAGNGIYGLEAGYDQLLGGYETIKVTYPADASGRVLSGAESTVSGDLQARSQLVTTIDTDIQRIVEQITSESMTTGAVIVSEVGSGKIRAMCSVPSFSPNNIAADINGVNSPFLNRTLAAYNVGSVFKLCVCAAALEAGVGSIDYTCTGSITVGGNVFNCHNHAGHGAQDLISALSNSCNPYFVTLGKLVGGDRIIDMCFALRFGRQKQLAAGVVSSGGQLPERAAVTGQPAALANLSFGQGELLLSPIDIAAMTEAIANGGEYHTPSLVEYTVDKNGSKSVWKSETHTAMSSQTAAEIREMMCSVVSSGTGRAAMPDNCTAGGKTATAETGWMIDGKIIDNSWFTGFFPADEPKYVVTVMVDGGTSGSVDCAPVFKRIADMICEKIG